MEWTGYDHARKLYYYWDTGTNTYMYENGLRVSRATPAVGHGGNVQTQTASYTTGVASHGRGPYGTSSDSSITSAFSNLSLGSYGVAPGSSNNNTSSYQAHPPTVRTDSDRSYVAVNYTYTPTQASGYMNNQASHTPHQRPAVDAATPGYAQPTSSTTFNRPSDGELLQNVGREVVLDPDAYSTPPDFPLLSQGLWPRRILRGSEETHGREEKLKPSFQIRYPGNRFFTRGVVFRVLWPELAGDVRQNITIATTGAFGEQTYYKIRWFVVIREGHNCCTCLPIQTYGGRGVPENKANGHHAIMYTGRDPPQPTPSEVVPTEPPMGEPIRVIGIKPWNTMDPMSRVNFLKLYTVEHNVKVEEFGNVDRDDEWKLMAQFKSHWSIDIGEPLPPVRHSRYYDGNTFGPAPPNMRPRANPGSWTAAPTQSSYNTSSTTPTPTMHNAQPSYPYQDTTAGTYLRSAHTTNPATGYSPPSTGNYQPYPQSNNSTYTASATAQPYSSYNNTAYAPTYNSNYASSHNTSYPSAAHANDDLYDDDRQTPRPRRPSEGSSDRKNRFNDQRRRR